MIYGRKKSENKMNRRNTNNQVFSLRYFISYQTQDFISISDKVSCLKDLEMVSIYWIDCLCSVIHWGGSIFFLPVVWIFNLIIHLSYIYI